MHAQLLSCVRLFVTLWTVALQAPWAVLFPRQEYLNELPFPSPGDLSDLGVEPLSRAFCIGRQILYQIWEAIYVCIYYHVQNK